MRGHGIPWLMMWVVAAWLSPRASGALAEADRVLLDTLLTMRQATLASSGEGHGRAILEEAHDNSAIGGVLVVRGPAEVQFAFSPSGSICWVTDAKTRTLVESALRVDDRRTSYSSGSGGQGHRLVEINKIERGYANVMMDERLQDWSFAELGRLPWNTFGEAERTSLGYIAALPDCRVTRHGHELEVVASSKRVFPTGDVKTVTLSLTAVFDLELGGMAERYSRTELTLCTRGTTLETGREETTHWVASNGKIVPKSREVTVRQQRDGRLEVSGKSSITFGSFRFEPVAADELNVGKLGVPVGTMVSDNILGIQYRFGTTVASTRSVPGAMSPNEREELNEASSTTRTAAATMPAGNKTLRGHGVQEGHWPPGTMLVCVIVTALVMTCVGVWVGRRRRPA